MMKARPLLSLWRRWRGLTLVEILVGLGIIAVLMAVAVPSLSDLLERRRVIAVTTEIVGMLNYAKAETNATNSLLYVRFDPQPASPRTMSCAAVVSSGGLNYCRCWQTPVCPNTTTSKVLRLFQLPLEHVGFAAGVAPVPGAWGHSANYIVFSRAQMGIAAQDFRVDVTGQKRGFALRVRVNNAGLVTVCAPNGDMSGYARCA